LWRGDKRASAEYGTCGVRSWRSVSSDGLARNPIVIASTTVAFLDRDGALKDLLGGAGGPKH
jgi:hypothetical protein